MYFVTPIILTTGFLRAKDILSLSNEGGCSLDTLGVSVNKVYFFSSKRSKFTFEFNGKMHALSILRSRF